MFRASVNTESEAKILQSIKQSWSLTDLCADYKLSPALIQQDLVQRFAANPDPVCPFFAPLTNITTGDPGPHGL